MASARSTLLRAHPELAVELANLRLLLSTRPITTSTKTAVYAACASTSLAQLVAVDAESGAPDSLLMLAAAAADMDAMRQLMQADANCRVGEDVFSALVEAVAADCDNLDVQLSYVLSRMIAVKPPRVSGPLRATVICAEKRWNACLCLLIQIDPWAMHYLYSLPSSIAAGDQAARAASTLAARIAAATDEMAAPDARNEANTATARAAKLLLKATKVGQTWQGNALRAAAARVAMHAMLRAHKAAGTLRAVVACIEERTRYWQAARLYDDVDAMVALADAGARTPIDADIFSSIVSSKRLWDASGASVSDEQLAVYLKRLHDAGVRTWQNWLNLPGTLDATMSCARYGLVHCLRAMVEVINPHARDKHCNGSTLLHTAAEGCHADCISYLIQAGWDVHARTWDCRNALDVCIEVVTDPAAFVAAIAALTAVIADVRQMLRSNVLSLLFRSNIDTKMASFVSCNVPFCHRHYVSRVLLHVGIVAASCERPAAPSWHLPKFMPLGGLNFCNVSLFRTEALDTHSVHGVHIPDQLRAGGDASAAVKLAVQVDVMIDLQPHAQNWNVPDGRPFLAEWQRHVQPHVIPGISLTMLSWAYMRRLHALLHRRTVLRELMHC